jgi:hypothetical protein
LPARVRCQPGLLIAFEEPLRESKAHSIEFLQNPACAIAHASDAINVPTFVTSQSSSSSMA